MNFKPIRAQRQPRCRDLPVPPQNVEFPYAKSRPELRDIDLGDAIRLIVEHPAWKETVEPLLDEVESERPKRGPAPAYGSSELATAYLFQILSGCWTYRQARDLLASDRHAETRRLLGFDKPRKRVGANRNVWRLMDGVPSQATMSRHMARVGIERQAEAFRKLFERVTAAHLQDPEMREEARTLNLDGSTTHSRYSSSPRPDGTTGGTLPPTLSGCGYGAHSNPKKVGHGCNAVTVATKTGIPLALVVAPLGTKGQSEIDSAIEIFKGSWPTAVAPYLDPQLSIITADGVFTGGRLTRELRRQAIVENCHSVSHADSSKDEVRKAERRIYEIQGTPNWRANGLYEFGCRCGMGSVKRISTRNTKGRAVVRTECSCPSCGPFMATSGLWRKAQNPSRFVRVAPGEDDKIDWRFGNFLTFHDPLSEAYGNARFGHGEGFFGAVVTRYKLLCGKRYFRQREQAEAELLLVYSHMHVLAMEQRKRKRENARAAEQHVAAA